MQRRNPKRSEAAWYRICPAGEEYNTLRRNREAELLREICALGLWGVWRSGAESERRSAWVLCLLCCLWQMGLFTCVLRLPGRKPLRHGSRSLTVRAHEIGGPAPTDNDKRVLEAEAPRVSARVE